MVKGYKTFTVFELLGLCPPSLIWPPFKVYIHILFLDFDFQQTPLFC
jgi:hypothetical protein